MMALVTNWYAAIDSDRTYHMRVTEYNTILPALKRKGTCEQGRPFLGAAVLLHYTVAAAARFFGSFCVVRTGVSSHRVPSLLSCSVHATAPGPNSADLRQ